MFTYLRTTIKCISLITLCSLNLLYLKPLAQDDENIGSVYLEDTKSKELLARAKAAGDKNDWKYAIELYLQVATKYPHEVCKIDSNKWVSTAEFVLQKISQLPQEAIDVYRFEYDAKASAQFKRAIEERDLTLLSQTIDKYFFATNIDEAIDHLANVYFEEGNLDTAILYWNRLIKYYPAPKVPLSSVVAKIAVAYRITGNVAGLDELEEYANNINGTINIGDRTLTIKEFLSDIKNINKADLTQNTTNSLVPDISAPYTKDNGQVILQNDIKRWTINSLFREESSASNNDTSSNEERVFLGGGRAAVFRRGGVFMLEDGRGNPQDQSLDYPYIPTYAKYGEKEYVFYQNGTTVVAFDPASGKVYWKYPDKTSSDMYQSIDAYGRRVYPALLGCAVDNRTVYINLYSKKKDNQPNEQNRNYNYRVQGPNIIQAIDTVSGKLQWSTETSDEIDNQIRDSNFTFSTHPVVTDNAVFVGISTSLSGEQESYVCSLDKRTGKLLWLTFISSLVSGQYYNYDSRGNYASITLLTDGGSNLVCLTNTGVVCTINKANGNIIWLTKYKKPSRGSYYNRPPNYPVVYNGKIYCLPQDAHPLLVYDKNSGALLHNPEQPDMKYLINVVDDVATLTSDKIRILRLSEGQSSETVSVGRLGRSISRNGFVYIPSDKGLVIFDTLLNKIVGDIKEWKDISDYGNVLFAGSNLITVSPNSATSYTNIETITSEYAGRVNADPPNLEGVLEFANLLLDNREFEPAVTYYLKYLGFTNGFTEYKDKITQARANINYSYMRLGEKLAGGKDNYLNKAIDYFTLAKSYSYNTQSLADAVVSIAETYEAKEEWQNAVDNYQEIIEKCEGSWYSEKDGEDKDLLYDVRLRSFEKISGLIKEKGKDIYTKYENLALQKLKEAGNDTTALEVVVSTYPNSQSAKTALNKLASYHKKQGNLKVSLSLLRLIKQRYGEGDAEVSYAIATILEEMKDYETLRLELQTIKEEIGDKIITSTGESVTAFADKKIKVAEEKISEINIPLKLPLNKLSELPKTGGAGTLYVPLMPSGTVPPTLDKNIELFTDGSYVETIDMAEKKTVWKYTSVPDGEGYLGATIEETADGNIKITSVQPNSPAKKQHLRGKDPRFNYEGDIITAVNGEKMGAKEFTDLIKKSKPGDEITLAILGTSKFTKKVTIGSQPVPMDKIVSAAFTSDYSLAVAYPSKVLLLDINTGKVKWEYTDVDANANISSIHPANDGILLLLRAKTPIPTKTETLIRPVEKNVAYKLFIFNLQLIYLDNDTGKVLWTRGLSMPNTQNIPQQSNLGEPFSITTGQNYASVTYISLDSNRGQYALNILLLDAKNGRQKYKDVIENFVTYKLDRVNGRILYIAVDRNKGNYSLHVIKLGSQLKDGKSPELWASELERSQQNIYQIAFSKDYISVVMPPDKIIVWKADSGKRGYDPKLRDGRVILANANINSCVMDENNVLFIYNYANAKPSLQRAFITAYDMDGEEDKLILWDETAPNQRDFYEKFYTGQETFALTGRSEGKPLAFIYDKRKGTFKYLELTTTPNNSSSPFNTYRNRLFLDKKNSVEVYGN
ncbi:MAG: hypothetical protein A2W23_10010 [Planctomycetes bacterium RBG_16_43_13]|nr:MAG: hypothetical protein A2W23_10010 [Planctomycetes bacterium RBG_16_43_13]